MKNCSIAWMLGFLGLFLACNPMPAQENWKFRTEKNGIKIYSRQQDGSALNTLRATFEMEATLSQYAAVVLDVDHYRAWNYAASNPHVVERINDTELLYYTEARAPWPVQDRFAILHLKVAQDPETKALTILLKNVPDRMPEQDGFVRIRDYSSRVTVAPLSASRVQVECIVRVDPGGSIPAWAANLVMEQMPVRTFSNLRERIRSQGNHRGAVPFISDK